MKDSDISYGIMQPYFLPYIGYYSLIRETDRWIVFDNIQYQRQSWGNRNRILKQNEGLTWIKIPLKKHKQRTLYSEIEIQNNIAWKDKLTRQFEYYRKNAPYYKEVIKLFEEIITPDFKYLVELNIFSMEKICKFLQIPFNAVRSSELNLNIKKVKSPGNWALQICKKMDIKKYINPCMGHFMFNKEDWDDSGIKLQFLMNKNLEYSQNRNVFEEKLSIIDVLMWNSVEKTHALMDSVVCSADCLTNISDEKVCDYDTMIKSIK